MQVTGHAVVRIADGAELGWWEQIPERLEIPGTQIVVFGAGPDWSAEGYRIEVRTREFADTPGVNPVLPAPLIPLSRRQFYEGLAGAGYITNAEALAAMAGVIPKALSDLAATIADPQEQFKAMMLLAGGRDFIRTYPLVEQFGEAKGLTSAQIDDLFRAWAAL